jgi:hypothetical protein
MESGSGRWQCLTHSGGIMGEIGGVFGVKIMPVQFESHSCQNKHQITHYFARKIAIWWFNYEKKYTKNQRKKKKKSGTDSHRHWPN